MSRSGYTFDAAGNITGVFTCSQDGDFEIQEYPMVEIKADHESWQKDPADYRVVVQNGKFKIERRAKKEKKPSPA